MEFEERGIYPTEFLQNSPVEMPTFKPLDSSDPIQKKYYSPTLFVVDSSHEKDEN
jgi:hypothetical protein